MRRAYMRSGGGRVVKPHRALANVYAYARRAPCGTQGRTSVMPALSAASTRMRSVWPPDATDCTAPPGMFLFTGDGRN